jgi:hypothetical protein
MYRLLVNTLWLATRALRSKTMEKWILTIITHVLEVASPELLQDIRISVDRLVTQAKGTDNPWDDVLAGFLQMLVGKPRKDA